MGRIAIIAAALAAIASTPAAASTLVLYDVPSEQARRVFGQPIPDQAIARETRTGMLRPVFIPIGDDGTQRTTVVDLFNPAPAPNFGPGFRVLRARSSWQVTVAVSGDQMSYDAILTAAQGFESGTGPPRDVATNEVRLVGVARMDGGGPAFMRDYATPSGSRTLVGFVQD